MNSVLLSDKMMLVWVPKLLLGKKLCWFAADPH